MATVLSRIGFSKKPNTKVYNLNPAVSDFSCKKYFDDPDLELESNCKYKRASYASAINQLHHRSSKSSSRGYSGLDYRRDKHRNDFCESGSFENQSVEVLEKYSVYKAEQTTQRINGCLKLAEDMSGCASRLLLNLHQQGEQITQTHQTAATFDHVLQRGEKLLGNLGGLLSRRWKPKKSRQIMGPVLTKNETFTRKCHYIGQRQKLGLNPPSPPSNHPRFCSGSSSVPERIELEKTKQDEALSELSNLLGKLKAMAVDMGSEIDRQNKALHYMQEDVDELNIRMKEANIRAHHLLR
ncbi:putative SNAP25 homologous protein SNAP30 [Dendrobium catenatum]|nr:putative SNAP25 homologous protein SNAP30 [Dendrobium catenatum]